jgi:hypothetical protein
MPAFLCSQCGGVDNTACCLYHARRGRPALCSECDPKIGKWHGMFEKRSAKGLLLASDGFLYDEKEDLSWRMANQGLTIIRKIE